MPILFTMTGASLLHFAEGVVLGANVYLAIKDARNR